MLEEFLAANPTDAFARYGLAMECLNASDASAAEGHFRQLVSSHADYVPAYYHYGQLQARLGHSDEAQNTFRAGIAAARKAGDAHALSELEAALDEVTSAH
jgi:Tfp pilus assembly protein PilF